MDGIPEQKCCISGIGMSAVGRRLGRDPMLLTIEASLRAIEDAGLQRSDIDGVSTYPGIATDSLSQGFTTTGAAGLQEALGLSVTWFCGSAEVPGQLGSVINAVLAVAAGLANNVLCFRGLWESTAQGTAGRAHAVTGIAPGGAADSVRARGQRSWALPYGSSYVNSAALTARRFMYEEGLSRADLGWVAVNGRRAASRNQAAVYREPLSIEEYLETPVLSSPMTIYDCDVPVDGAVALVVSRRDRAGRSDRDVAIEAMGCAAPLGARADHASPQREAAAASLMWSRTKIGPSDVDVAEVYDGFSFYTLFWLQALGFCRPGGMKAFLVEGLPTSRHDHLPVNTDGGQLSAGRLHGYGKLHEACLQLRGEAGSHQLPTQPEVAVVSGVANSGRGCMVLARQ